MISSLELTSGTPFTIYNDQVFYSHDGHFVFMLVINKQGFLEKAIICRSDYLSVPDSHEI